MTDQSNAAQQRNEKSPEASNPAEKEEPAKPGNITSIFTEHGWLFKTPDGTPYAYCPNVTDAGGSFIPTTRHDFPHYVRYIVRHYQRSGYATHKAIAEAVDMITSAALFDSPTVPVHNRVALHDGAYWFDMGDKAGRMIRVTKDGWEIRDGFGRHSLGAFREYPVFIRPKDVAPFPEPTPTGTGNVEDLWTAANIPEAYRDLTTAWMLETFRPDTPYPVFVLCGNHGSAKSETQVTIRALIDPSVNPLKKPANEDGLRAMAANEHVITYENASSLTVDMQDTLCSLATGGGGSVKRAHHENTGMSVVAAKKPVMINAIPNPITRPDLLSRAIVVTAEKPAEYITTKELAERRAAVMSSAFGGLLDLFVATLAKIDDVEITDNSFRLADFVRLGEAMSQVRGRKPGAFVERYAQAVQDTAEQTVEEHVTARAIVQLLDKNTKFDGTVGDLYNKLKFYSGGERDFPNSPRRLGNDLRRIEGDLERVGIRVVQHGKQNGTRRLKIFRKPIEGALGTVTQFTAKRPAQVDVTKYLEAAGISAASPTITRH